MPMSVDRLVEERVARVERQLATCANSYEAPNGKVMMRVWVTDLAAVTKLARTALASVSGEKS